RGLVWSAALLFLVGLVLSPLLPKGKARVVLTGSLALAIAEGLRLRDREPAAAVLGLSAWLGSGTLAFMFSNGSLLNLLSWSLLPEASRARFDWAHWLGAAAPLGIFVSFGGLALRFLLLRPA